MNTRLNHLTFDLDLRRSAEPEVAVGGADLILDIPRPATGFDAKRGLRFPLADTTALLYWSCGKLNDRAGTVVLRFTLDTGDRGGTLLRLFGSYLSLTATPARECCELRVTFYGHDLRLLVPFTRNRPVTVALSWHHRTGVRLSADRLSVARNITWHSYPLQRFPLEIGGALAEIRPNNTHWQSTFNGWLVAMTCHSQPLEAPGISAAESAAMLKSDSRLVCRPGEPPPAAGPTAVLVRQAARLASVSAAAPEHDGRPRPSLPGGYTLLELHDPPLLDSPVRFDCLPARLANYRACQRAHPELAALYHGAPTAFEGLRAVGRYISNLWPHTSYWPWPRAIFEERGDTLLAGIKAGEICGMCGGYAHTMEEALWALGVPARRTQVYGHSSLEAYDFTHDKWICLETDNANGHAGCWLAPDGVPYAIGELGALLEQDRLLPGTFRQQARHLYLDSTCPSGRLNGTDVEANARHTYIYMGYFKRRDYGVKGDPESFWYYPPWYRPRRLDPYTPVELQNRVNDWRTLYWSCQRVQVTADWQRAGTGTVDLHLRPFQAQFHDGYQVTIDGQPRPQRGSRLTWRLHPGVNRIAIAARNALGAVGHPWRAVLAG